MSWGAFLATAFMLSGPESAVSVSPRVVDLGEIMEHEARQATVLVENRASVAVSLREAGPNCSRLTWGLFEIGPGGTAELELALAPPGRLGYFEKEAFFSVAPLGETFSIKVIGKVVSGFRTSPQVVHLRAAQGQRQADRKVELRAGRPFRVASSRTSDPRVVVTPEAPEVLTPRHRFVVSLTEGPHVAFAAELFLDLAVGGEVRRLTVPVRVSVEEVGATKAGRVLRVIYSPDPGGKSAFVITAYDLQGKPLAAYRRRQRRR